ncbi:MAG: dihydrolipoyl dehydrogenase [Myxococcales bacterium FL481]|nr:MAG: dihydrolipoyl dehydrogenase [Myxococcales bacterium FL481]
MPNLKTTVLIIGAGTGGYPCAIRLGQLGVDAILVEKALPGGVCLNWGCIPSKALISATKLYTKAQEAADMGLEFSGAKVDLPKMQTWKAGIVNKLTTGVRGLVKGSGTQYIEATAEIVSPKQVVLRYADGKPDDTVETEHIVVATGSVPISIPGFEIDQKRVLDSTGALALDKIPGEMVCIGGGVIGLELGQTFQRLGTKLTVLEGLDRILGTVEKDCAALVNKQIIADGGTVHTKARATGWEERDGRAIVKADIDGKPVEIPADVILLSVGRRPVAKGFGLEKLGVQLDERGFIRVDKRQATSVPGIWAVGDVVGQPMLAHKASHEGEVLAEVLAGKNAINDARVIPNVVFTEPEIASAGLGAQEAKDAGYTVDIGKFPFSVSGRAMAIGEAHGFVKIVTDQADGRVLGVHIVGPEASDLISEAALAIEMGAFAEDISLTIHPHPTLGEAVMEAAKHAIGEAVHIPNRRKR